LGKKHRKQFFSGIEPEKGTGSTTPVMFTSRCDDLCFHRVDDHGKTEPKANKTVKRRRDLLRCMEFVLMAFSSLFWTAVPATLAGSGLAAANQIQGSFTAG
jgi:hypothetical protein